MTNPEFALAPGVMPTPTLPAITALTRPFWDAAASGRLLLPLCKACGKHFFRPEVACTHCFATDWQWVPASGRGTLYSYTVVHRASAPGFTVPFVLAVVELAEGPAMLSNLVACSEAQIRVGMVLRVRYLRWPPAPLRPRSAGRPPREGSNRSPRTQCPERHNGLRADSSHWATLAHSARREGACSSRFAAHSL